MILDHQDLETLLFLVRERRHSDSNLCRAPQAIRDKLVRLEADGFLLEKKLLLAMQSDVMRGAHAFEARADGSLIIYATLPDGDGEPICIEPQRVAAVLAACGDALAKKPRTR